MFLSREGRDLGVAFQDPPGSQASSGGEAKDSAVLPSRDADILEPPSGVNGVKPPLHFGERARDDGQGGLACCDSWGHKESDTTEAT